MGWNYTQAQRATGINNETWRAWEKGIRHCTNEREVAHRVSEVTGYSFSWLLLGGPPRGLPQKDSNLQPAD